MNIPEMNYVDLENNDTIYHLDSSNEIVDSRQIIGDRIWHSDGVTSEIYVDRTFHGDETSKVEI